MLFVRDVMTRDVVTLGEADKLAVAEDVMRLGRIRHLPVLNAAGRLVGIVSQRDLFHSALMRAWGNTAEPDPLQTHGVREAMQTSVITVSEDTELQGAARLMLEHKVGCLVVMREQQLVGILTESDFVRLFASPTPR